jgi:hypothetical protein
MDATTETLTLALPEGAVATCAYCDMGIVLDVREGGGDPENFGAWDWGTTWSFGMDYGCGDNPESDDEGTGGHAPIWQTICFA